MNWLWASMHCIRHCLTAYVTKRPSRQPMTNGLAHWSVHQKDTVSVQFSYVALYTPLYPVCTMEQTSSKCIQNARANCSTSARRLLDRVNGVLGNGPAALAYILTSWVVAAGWSSERLGALATVRRDTLAAIRTVRATDSCQSNRPHAANCQSINQ